MEAIDIEHPKYFTVNEEVRESISDNVICYEDFSPKQRQITEFYVMNENISNTFEHNGATVHKNIEESQLVQQTIDNANEPSLKSCFHECATHFDNLEATTPRKPNHNTLDTNNAQVPLSEPITAIGIDEIQLNDKPGNLTLQGTIGGEQHLFLVDTGAAITAISGVLWQRLPTKNPLQPNPSMSIRTVTGNPMTVRGMVLISFVIDGGLFTHKVFVVDDLSHDVILGKDFLERYKSKIDLEHHTLHLQDDLPFERFSSSEFDSLQDNTCSVHALYSYILPPNFETIICGKLNTPFPQGSIGIVDPRAELSTRYHVCGAAELVSTSMSGTVPIRLLNPSNQAVRIFRRSTLGTFSPTGEDLLAISLSDPPSPDLETTSEAALPQNPPIPFDLSNTTLSLVEQEKLQALLLQ